MLARVTISGQTVIPGCQKFILTLKSTVKRRVMGDTVHMGPEDNFWSTTMSKDSFLAKLSDLM